MRPLDVKAGGSGVASAEKSDDGSLVRPAFFANKILETMTLCPEL
jgi:hypothetical protein